VEEIKFYNDPTSSSTPSCFPYPPLYGKTLYIISGHNLNTWVPKSQGSIIA
jgi:hypothetical protein